MANNDNLSAARKAKQDEFYTTWDTVQREMDAYIDFDPDVFRGKTVLCPCDDPEFSNFTKFFIERFDTLGINTLVSTSFNENGRGKILVIDPTAGHTDPNSWTYLDGDGDFRSDEITRLRDQSDVVVTNPPFSLFREFMSWVVEGGVQFSVIGNLNAITYRDIFPLIRSNKLWLGESITNGDREFKVPPDYPLYGASCRTDEQGQGYVRVPGVRWFTNIPHGRRNEPLSLKTMNDNLMFGSKKVRELRYPTYDNYDAIEVCQTAAIPSDYPGAMGVPITFLDKYNPDQFEILGSFNGGGAAIELGATSSEIEKNGKVLLWNGPIINRSATYKRIVIRHRNPTTPYATRPKKVKSS